MLLLKRSGGVALLLSVAAIKCGGSNGVAPTMAVPITAADFVGTWTDGNGRTWNLTAGAAQVETLGVSRTVIQAGGPSTLAQGNHPIFGAISVRGGVLGTMVVGLTDLQFAETYDGGFPQNENDCYIDTQGDLILSGNTMTGVVTEHDGCNGTILRDVASKLILQRQ